MKPPDRAIRQNHRIERSTPRERTGPTSSASSPRRRSGVPAVVLVLLASALSTAAAQEAPDGSNGETPPPVLASFELAAGSSAPRPGQVVGHRGGAVSLRTSDADGVFVAAEAADTAETPAPIGSRRVPVLLLGRTAVRVSGPVAAGDFLVPSGRDDGLARAVAPGQMRAEDAGRILGRALAASQGRNRVQALVGFPPWVFGPSSSGLAMPRSPTSRPW